MTVSIAMRAVTTPGRLKIFSRFTSSPVRRPVQGAPAPSRPPKRAEPHWRISTQAAVSSRAASTFLSASRLAFRTEGEEPPEHALPPAFAIYSNRQPLSRSNSLWSFFQPVRDARRRAERLVPSLPGTGGECHAGALGATQLFRKG